MASRKQSQPQNRIEKRIASLSKEMQKAWGISAKEAQDIMNDFTYPQIKRAIEGDSLPDELPKYGMLSPNPKKRLSRDMQAFQNKRKERSDRSNYSQWWEMDRAHQKRADAVVRPGITRFIKSGSIEDKAIKQTQKKAQKSFGKALFPALPYGYITPITLRDSGLKLPKEVIREHNAMLKYNPAYAKQAFEAAKKHNKHSIGEWDTWMW